MIFLTHDCDGHFYNNNLSVWNLILQLDLLYNENKLLLLSQTMASYFRLIYNADVTFNSYMLTC